MVQGDKTNQEKVGNKDGKNKAKEDPKKKDGTKGATEDPKKKDGTKGAKGDSKTKDGKKEAQEGKPGMSFMFDPCPHRVWTPKPGERDKSEPRGAGSPWYEPTRKKEDVDREEAEKSKEKEEKAKAKRDKARQEKEKAKEEQEKENKEKEEKKKEKEKKKEENKKKKEEQKKKEEDEKRKKQKEEREKEKEKKKKEEEENKDKDKKKEKQTQLASYMYEPCPHKVYSPSPGAQDLGDPKGINSPWYVQQRKKEDIEKEAEEENKKDMKKRKEQRKKREQEKEEKKKQEQEEMEKRENEFLNKDKKRQEKLKKQKEEEKNRREQIEKDHEEMGAGVRDSRTDFTQEMIWMMDFISDVDEKERERKGEALRWKKEEIEEKIESCLAKEAFVKDFKKLVFTFVQAEWLGADKTLKRLEKEERKKRRKLLKNMDPLAQDMIAEGKRFTMLYQTAMGEKKKKESGEVKSSSIEDLMIGKIMQQLDKMDSSSVKQLFK